MRVVSFYSYKGGVGRTLACANYGLYLAKTGQSVVLLDMDFEAPGLDSKFGDGVASQVSHGLIDQMLAFLARRPLPALTAIDIHLPQEVTQPGGRLRLIPAGNHLRSDEYYRKLASLDWQALLREQEGLAFWFDLLDRIKKAFKPNFLVIDSRTGFTEVGGLCTQVLPDTVLLLTSMSPESLAGTRRIYERIRQSPIVKSRGEGRCTVDLRVIVTRVPRPRDFELFDRSAHERLGIELDRLYYLFADAELASDEYLAMNRFAEEHPALLDDYVELFASLNPEATLPYIEARLDAFRQGITRRPLPDNRRIIQELLTLFPRPEVYLEAARYYRLIKDGEVEAMLNYGQYLDCRGDDGVVLDEFADMCAVVSLVSLMPHRERIVRYLRRIGPQRMRIEPLQIYLALAQQREDILAIVAAIEGNENREESDKVRTVYLKALRDLKQWGKLVQIATESDERDAERIGILATAYAHERVPLKALELFRNWPIASPRDAAAAFETLYAIRDQIDEAELRRLIQDNPRLRDYSMSMITARSMQARGEDPRGIRVWMRNLVLRNE